MSSLLLLIVLIVLLFINVNSFLNNKNNRLSSYVSILMSTKIDVVSKDMQVTEPIRDRINQKIGKVVEKLGQPNLVNSAHVTLRLHRFANPSEHHSLSTKKDSQIAEVTLRMKGGKIIHTSERTDDMYSSIDLCRYHYHYHYHHRYHHHYHQTVTNWQRS